MAQAAAADTKYTVFIKLPFPRGDFVDPPSANWNAAKEAELWRTIMTSTPSRSAIDWEELAEHFDVPTAFIMQQAAWLLNRLNSHVRGNMSAKHTKQASTSGSIPVAGQAMKRAGSGQGQGSRAPSALSIRPKLSTDEIGNIPQVELIPSPVWKTKAPYSRTTSTTTITQLHKISSAQQSPKLKQRTLSTEQAPGSPLTITSTARSPSDSSEDSSSSDSEPAMTQSRMYTRRSRFPPTTKGKGRAKLDPLSSTTEGSDSDSFFPFSNAAKDRHPELKAGRTQDKTLSADHNSVLSSGTMSSPNQPPSSDYSGSSPREHPDPREEARKRSTLSPRLQKMAKEDSESTVSMGSSFSDLDDTSISRSAMEEALAREIKAGRISSGVTSRLGEFWRQNGPGGSNAPGHRRTQN